MILLLVTLAVALLPGGAMDKLPVVNVPAAAVPIVFAPLPEKTHNIYFPGTIDKQAASGRN